MEIYLNEYANPLILTTHNFLMIWYSDLGQVMASALWLKTMVKCLRVGLNETKMFIYKKVLNLRLKGIKLCLNQSYRGTLSKLVQDNQRISSVQEKVFNTWH